MKAKASQANDQITDEGDKKDGVMVISQAIGNALVCQVYES
jgi:hypothetical protein